MINRNPKLNKIVSNNPIKSSINLFEDWILGGIEPIYRCEVNLDIRIVDISPIKELSAGKAMMKIGIAYIISSFEDNKVPENNPITEDIMTTTIDSLKIFL